MNKTLLFLPDISGYTEFVQTTEINHSQYIIAELLEILIDANTEQLQLAEIEGDALFFYKEEIPSLEKLLAQVETIFIAFYNHLKMFEKNRICQCNACSTAPKLELKIIAHCGKIEFISVKNKNKPFGTEVIEVHRLMKNSIQSNNYVLFTEQLNNEIGLLDTYQSKLFQFNKGDNSYDGKSIPYLFAVIDKEKLKLKRFKEAKKFDFKRNPEISVVKEFPVSANELMEFITNFSYRKEWVEGVEDFLFNPNEINRLGTEHVCVIGGKHLDFTTITKNVMSTQLVYGEFTTTPPQIDAAYQFYIITPLEKNKCRLEVEGYIEAKSIIKKLLLLLIIKKTFQKNTAKAIGELHQFILKGTIS